MTLPLLHLAGTPYQQGLDHGRLLRDRIHHNVAVYLDRFEKAAQLTRDEALARARRYRDAIAGQSQDYFDGMRGIADGAGLPLDVIVALNVRYEIIYYQTAALAMATPVMSEVARDGCTAFAIAPEASANGHLLLGQNWDWIPLVQGALLHTAEPDGLETLSFTEAGIFGGKIGLNSAGLGLVINGITSTRDSWLELNAPFHLRCYQILRSRTVEAAVAVIAGTPRACSANYLLAQAPDCVANVEAAPHTIHRLTCHDGLVVHANHFVDPQGAGIEEPPNPFRDFSCRRADRLHHLIQNNLPASIGDLQCYLQDHTNPPRSICRHDNPADPPAEQFRTVTSVVMDLYDRTLQLTDGPPCQNPYRRYTLAYGEASAIADAFC